MAELRLEVNGNTVATRTSEIVVAYVSHNVVPAIDLSRFILDVHTALFSDPAPPPENVVEKQKPAISVRKSLQEDHLVCLNCGGSYKSLKRHLMAHHSISPKEYREAWKLPNDYPMVAPAYSEVRSKLAKKWD
jgi:predicted transcriptional regulator